MTKERKFQRTYSEKLLKIAQSDLEAAKVLFENGFSRKETMEAILTDEEVEQCIKVAESILSAIKTSA